ncbi:transposase [Fusibacter ferrireducens]|uniref:Transposase n=1 Tax=Fusibacter ferrireducens TaxID=2785058 RepID=A0ABR9ZST8_9FIRM|nr:transposase [Fusibacter ferrireducens]MBF4692940.1 transposase [Fusibacter ferrireducens]
MARKARDAEVYGLYHIYQLGNQNRKLFESHADRQKFLEILSKARKRFGFKLYAYCIKTSDQYHLIVDTNGSDLSKVMKSINIAYAMYAKCDGKLFRDRYKSEVIETPEALNRIMEALHKETPNNEYNSYCVYESQMDANLLIDIEPLSVLTDEQVDIEDAISVCNRNRNQEKQPCENCIKDFDEAQNALLQKASNEGYALTEVFSDKAIRNQYIHYFRKHSLLSLKELGQLFDGLTESTVCKILSQK